MGLPIEEWLTRNALDADAAALFSESLTAFRAQAPRAALLLSYLGFLTIVKSRLTRAATAPPGIPAPVWQNLQRDIRDDSEWDPAAFESTQRKQPAPIFPVTDDLRAQVAYWRARRNDCAHAKTRHVGHAHVEAFWAFVIGESAKFCIAGGPDDLFADIERHYDPTYTAPGAPCDQLVARLAGAVALPDFPAFLERLRARFSSPILPGPNGSLLHLLDGIVGHAPEPYRTEAVRFLARDARWFGNFAVAHPSRITEFSAYPDLIRSLWRDRLFGGFDRGLPVFSHLLRTGMIPAPERAEAVHRAVERLAHEVPDEQDVAVLEACGFFNVLHHDAFVGGKIDQFSWGNPKANIVAWMLARYGVNQDAVRSICTHFDGPPFSNGARDALQEMFTANPARAQEFKNIVAQLQLVAPAAIPVLCT